MTTLLAASAGTFGVGHIAVTAALTAALALAAAVWRLPGTMLVDQLAVAVLTFAAYADLRGPAEPRRFAQTRALATIAALVVNVVTI